MNEITLNSVFQVDDKFIASLDVTEFEKMFGVKVNYLDMNLEENKDNKPIELLVNLNVDQGDIVFNSDNNTLLLTGDYSFIDGLKKFDIMQIHPNSHVQITISSYDKNEVRNYLGQTKDV